MKDEEALTEAIKTIELFKGIYAAVVVQLILKEEHQLESFLSVVVVVVDVVVVSSCQYDREV